MQKKLLLAGIFLYATQSAYITYGNIENDLENLKKLEIELITLAQQIKTPITSQPPQQPKQPSRQPKRKNRRTKPQPTQKTQPAPTTTTENFAEQISKEALELTNKFRDENKRPPLQWNKTLADLSTEHSQNMASGKVPFSHDGFGDRANRAKFRATAENVLMTSPRKDLAQIAVDSWIKSPDHKKNLLGDYNFCGIGAYKDSKGFWYFTQMFGK